MHADHHRLHVAAATSPTNQPTTAEPPAQEVEIDWSLVRHLQDQVAKRTSKNSESFDGIAFDQLDDDDKIEMIRALATEEMGAWLRSVQAADVILPTEEQELRIIQAVVDAASGLGRIRALLNRDDVEDIFINGTHPVVLRLSNGSKIEGPPVADSIADLRQLLKGLSEAIGDGAVREFSSANPLLNLRLPAVGLLGARMAAAMDVTPNPCATIRVHRHADVCLADIKNMGTINSPIEYLLEYAMLAGLKIVVAGAPGAGKTVLLRALAAAIPLDQHIITIEDDRELGIHVLPKLDEHGNVVLDPRTGKPVPRRPAALVRAYEARPANAEGVGEITMDDLGMQSLRDSPDYILYGETRGREITQMWEGVANGIKGCAFTIHSEDIEGTFDRFVQLGRKATPPLSEQYTLEACRHLDLIVQIRKGPTGKRFVTDILEVTRDPLHEATGRPQVRVLFAPGEDGRAVPKEQPSGKLIHRLAQHGFDPAYMSYNACDWAPMKEARVA